MSFGNQELFNNININIDDYEKVGIVGLNGAGKSTFLKIVYGQIAPDKGKVIIKNNTRVAYLPQVIKDEIPEENITVFDFLLLGRPIDKLNKELEKLYIEISSAEESKLNDLYKKINIINQELEYWESYSAENTLLKIIDGMNIDDNLLEKPLNTLSGGQKSKIAFARLLYSKPEIILLDEPTNHLDIDTKEYIINYIKNYKGGVYVISHDIEFLNEVTTKTLFLDKRLKTFELFNGNYDKFKKVIDHHELEIERKIEKQQEEEIKLRKIIEKYTNSSGNRKKMAQDREKKLEKLLKDKITSPVKSKELNLKININRESTKYPLTVDKLSFKYDKSSKRYILHNLSFSLSKGEKFLIVGVNGVGKSTLLKLIMNRLNPDKGEIIIGDKTDLGYYAQEHELLDNNKSIIDNFNDIDISTKELRNVLGRFLFYEDDVYKKVSILSPGERSRLSLAKLSLTGANLLVLDEPTNHLDPETQKIIANTFKTFKGTMLVVSHNPEFVDNLGIERVLILPTGQIDYYKRDIIEHYKMINTKDND
jgi:ATPase components of ABC transporters with duplicated ATPase domains